MEGFYDVKEFAGYVKDVDIQNRVITGVLSSFDGEEDSYKDIATYGMFTKTIAERGPKGSNEIMFLNQHKWHQPHGKFAELSELKDGLHFVSQKLPNTSYSNDTIELYAAGIVKEHSFGYQTIKSDFDKESGVRTLLEVKLYEGSNVTLGADRNTPFTGFKGGIKELNDHCQKITKFLRNGNVTDDTFIQLEIALKQLQLEAYELGKKSLDEPLNNTQIIEPITIIKEFNKQLFKK